MRKTFTSWVPLQPAGARPPTENQRVRFEGVRRQKGPQASNIRVVT